MYETTMTISDLSEYVGCDEATPRLSEYLEIAEGELNTYLTNAFREMPASTYDQLVLEVASAFYARRSGSQGGQFANTEIAPRPQREPLWSVMPTLRRYVCPV
jgi:hypothetical protein